MKTSQGLFSIYHLKFDRRWCKFLHPNYNTVDIAFKAAAKRSQYFNTTLLAQDVGHVKLALAAQFQHATTHRNRVAKLAQHVLLNSVAIRCIEMLQSFGWGLRSLKMFLTSTAMWMKLQNRSSLEKVNSCLKFTLYYIFIECRHLITGNLMIFLWHVHA